MGEQKEANVAMRSAGALHAARGRNAPVTSLTATGTVTAAGGHTMVAPQTREVELLRCASFRMFMSLSILSSPCLRVSHRHACDFAAISNCMSSSQSVYLSWMFFLLAGQSSVH